MTTEQLNEFYILSITLSYSKAAEKLYISQSTLSRHIKSMEEELNVHLFSRSTRNVVLTNEGKFLQTQIPLLLKRTMDIESILNSEFINTDGRVSVLYSTQTLNTGMLQFLRNFQEQYENISLEIEPLLSYPDIDMIYNTDIMISACDFIGVKPSDIDAMLATTQSAVLAIPPYHYFGNESTVSLFDLRDETLIVPHEDDLTGPYAQLSFLAKHKCYGHLSKINASTEDQALLLVELGRGVMILPHHLKHHVYAHTRTIPISDAECSFPIYTYYNRSNNNGAAALFFRSMMKHFQKKSI
ncbi:MAG: LysR family transcriptional regulator [Lachnospiraceae bacterium]|nr:LysR family transcriptional regulator [Lachnospiraceae bacterium]